MRRHPNRSNRWRWEQVRRAVFEAAAYRCELCGKPGALECDHRQPIFQGGAEWDRANLQALCRGCHLAKSKRERRPVGPGAAAWESLARQVIK